MKQTNIYILSGPVHSGKTSRLRDWLQNRDNVDGILAPVIDNQRYLMHIGTEEIKRVQLVGSEKDLQSVWQIGDYIFSQAVFKWAQQILFECSKQKPDWLILDEVGFLELQGKGFDPVITQILSMNVSLAPANILLVVRDKLVEKVTRHYNLTDRPEKFIFPD